MSQRCCSAFFFSPIPGEFFFLIFASIPSFQFNQFSIYREVILEKQLTGHRVDRSICNWFWDQPHSFKQQPVIASPTHYLFQVFRDGITFLACTQVEMPPLMAIEVIIHALIFNS